MVQIVLRDAYGSEEIATVVASNVNTEGMLAKDEVLRSLKRFKKIAGDHLIDDNALNAMDSLFNFLDERYTLVPGRAYAEWRIIFDLDSGAISIDPVSDRSFYQGETELQSSEYPTANIMEGYRTVGI